MYDKKLFEKICNATCTFEELESFVIKIDKKEFDLDNPFEKYYDVEKILFVIRRYEMKEIGAKYLAYWMNAYNWIIMGGFKIKARGNLIPFKQLLEWVICDWLDSLSFFDPSEEWFVLDEYKNAFTVLSKVYCTIKDWDKVFAYTDEGGFNDDDIVVLAYHKKCKQFVKIYSELIYCQLDVEKIKLDELEKRVEELRKEGYQELKYGTWDEEDY